MFDSVLHSLKLKISMIVILLVGIFGLYVYKSDSASQYFGQANVLLEKLPFKSHLKIQETAKNGDVANNPQAQENTNNSNENSATGQLATLGNEITSKANELANQAVVLKNRSLEVGQHTSNVLGSSITATNSAEPIHEKALEYAQYLYCQGVVKEYEASR